MNLASIASGVEGLKSIVITGMPDGLLYDSWTDGSTSFSPDELAAYFGDIVRANQEALQLMRAMSDAMQITIESGGLLIVLRRAGAQFVASFIFEKDAPLGMVRLNTRQMLNALTEYLPANDAQQESRGVRVLSFLDRYSPDPHTALLRVAVKTKIPLDVLRDADELSAEDLESVEQAVRDVLGLESLNL